MEKLTLLEKDIFDSVFLLNGVDTGIESSVLDNHSYADCRFGMFKFEKEEKWAQISAYPVVLMRANDIEGRIYNNENEEPEQFFNFNDLPLCKQLKLFILGKKCDFDAKYLYVDIYALAPACQYVTDLEKFYALLDKYEKHPQVYLPAIKHSRELAKFLHRNYVTEENFRSSSGKSGNPCTKKRRLFIFWQKDKLHYSVNNFNGLFWM